MSGLLSGLLQGAVRARAATLQGEEQGLEIARLRDRDDRLQRAQGLAAAIRQHQVEAAEARDRARDERERARDDREAQFRVGELATRGVFTGAVPTADPANPTRYRDLGNGTYYDSDFSPTHRTVLESAAHLATAVARRNAARNPRLGDPAHFRGVNGQAGYRPTSLPEAERARAAFADHAAQAGDGDPQRAMGLLEGSAGSMARAKTLGMAWPDYLAAAERHRTAHAPHPTARDAKADGDEQLRLYLSAKAQLRAQGKSDAEIRATLGAAPI